MISRSTLIGALVVVELGIVGAAVRSLTGDAGPGPAGAFAGAGTFGNAGGAGASRTPLDRSFTTGPAPHVVVDVKDVGVVVQTAAGSDVRVVEHLKTFGWVSGGPVPVQAERTADGVRIVARDDGGVHLVLGGIEHLLVITVPSAAAVEVRSSDRIDATGLRARFAAHTDDGSIHVHDQRGDLELSSGNGRIELVDVRAADVTARTDNGRLLLTRVAADRLDVSTDNGRVEATAVRLAGGAIVTRNGRVNVAYTSDSDATLTVHSADGRVDVAGAPAAAAADGDGHQRVVRLGAGSGRFEISTDNGNVHLTQGAQS